MAREGERNSRRRRLLVTGASGFLGWNVCRLLSPEWDVFGVVSSHPAVIPEVTTVRVDLTRFRDMKEMFHRVQPHAVIHTAAMASPNACQVNVMESRLINVDAAVEISGLCAEGSISLVFTSTDLVFNGLRAPYGEEDPVTPVNVYAEHKVLAEEGILRRYPEATVCRMPLMFGDCGPHGESFIQPMIRAMKEGKGLKLFTDEFRTPASARDAVKGLVLAMNSVKGIIHLGGPQRISRYQMGELLADVLGIPNPALTPCRSQDLPMPAPRSLDVSLKSEKAFSLGYAPGRIREELMALTYEEKP